MSKNPRRDARRRLFSDMVKKVMGSQRAGDEEDALRDLIAKLERDQPLMSSEFEAYRHLFTIYSKEPKNIADTKWSDWQRDAYDRFLPPKAGIKDSHAVRHYLYFFWVCNDHVRARLHDDQELWRRVVEEDPFFRFPVPLALYQAEDQAVYYLVGKRSTANRLAKLEYRTCPTLGRVGTSIDGQRARGMSDASMSSASTAPGGIKSLKVELNLDSWLEGYDFPHRPLFQSVERKGKGSSMQHGEGGMGGLRAVNTLLPFELGREIFRSSDPQELWTVACSPGLGDESMMGFGAFLSNFDVEQWHLISYFFRDGRQGSTKACVSREEFLRLYDWMVPIVSHELPAENIRRVSKLVSALRRGDHEEKLLMLRLDATDERLLQAPGDYLLRLSNTGGCLTLTFFVEGTKPNCVRVEVDDSRGGDAPILFRLDERHAFACFKDVITVVSSSLYRGRPYRLRQLGYESNSAEHEYFLVPRAERGANKERPRPERTESTDSIGYKPPLSHPRLTAPSHSLADGDPLSLSGLESVLSDALADSSMMQDEQQAEETTYVMPTAYPVATPAQPCSIYQQPHAAAAAYPMAASAAVARTSEQVMRGDSLDNEIAERLHDIWADASDGSQPMQQSRENSGHAGSSSSSGPSGPMHHAPAGGAQPAGGQKGANWFKRWL